MNGVEKQVRIPPVSSPSLPGFSIDANVCRNPACQNFGISEQDIPSAKQGYSFKTVKKVLKYTCKRCNQTQTALSNVSVLEAFHRCLSNSIPYASCTNEKCKNHYVNLFEHYHGDLRDKRQKLYRINVADDAKQHYQARCRSCDKTFRLSQPLRLHTTVRRSWKKDMDTFISMIVNGLGPSKVMNLTKSHSDLYYSQLKAASNVLLEYNNFHLINLMKPSGAQENFEVFTDCIVCSIKTHRNDQRAHLMKIVVSTCERNDRTLILAFHPLFDQGEIEDPILLHDDDQPFEQQQFTYRKHPFKLKNEERKDEEPLAPLRLDGNFMEESYAYMAHFLVLRKILSRMKSIQFCMDGEALLYNAALNVFSDRIKSGTCDVVVRILEKSKASNQSKISAANAKRFQQAITQAEKAYGKAHPGSKRPTIPELRRFALKEEMGRVNDAIKNSTTRKNGELFPEPLSRIFTAATKRAKSSGSEFWVTSKITDKRNPDVRMLWLTRKTAQSNNDFELDLYDRASKFIYIDWLFGHMRERSAMAARPVSSASGHKNYNKHPELPMTTIQDFVINIAFWNFFLKHRQQVKSKGQRKDTIAYVHGLVRKPESPETKDVFKPRYTFANAKRISQWLGI
jgi:hypothetical protein